jgi:hypothetical protein
MDGYFSEEVDLAGSDFFSDLDSAFDSVFDSLEDESDFVTPLEAPDFPFRP